MASSFLTVVIVVWGVIAMLVALLRRPPATPAERRAERIGAWSGLVVAAALLASDILGAHETLGPVRSSGLLLVIAAEIIILATARGPLAVERSRVEPED